MGVNKVQLANGETILDITGATITPETVLEGYIGYGADGERIVGTATTAKHFAKNVILSESRWNSENQQTVTVNGVLADPEKCTVWVGCDISSNAVCEICEVECIAQGNNFLTFQCSYLPDEDVTMNVTVLV